MEGIFKAKDVVAISDQEGNVIGKGIVSLDHREIAKIKGLKTDHATKILGKS